MTSFISALDKRLSNFKLCLHTDIIIRCPNDVFVNENVNPLANIQFFDKSDYNKSYKIKMKEISNLMPLHFIETDIQYISKS